MSTNHPSMICRCSDLDLEEIRALIAGGFTSVDEIKRIARLGMGPCQGRTCIPLVLQELSRVTGKPVAELMPTTYRPPVKGIPMGAIADAAGAHIAADRAPDPAERLEWKEEGGGAP